MNADAYRVMNKGRQVAIVKTEKEARKLTRGISGYFYLPIHYTPARSDSNLVNEYPNGSDADIGL